MPKVRNHTKRLGVFPESLNKLETRNIPNSSTSQSCEEVLELELLQVPKNRRGYLPA